MSFTNDNNILSLKIVADDKLARAILAQTSEEDLQEIEEAIGMTGAKYRQMALKAVQAGLQEVLTDKFNARTDQQKGFLMTSACISIGMFLGVVSSKMTLTKNIGSYMAERTVKDDAIAVAYRIIESKFKTYVNEQGAPVLSFPSVKYPSCMADFVLLGICLLLAKRMTIENLAAALVMPFPQWPELLRKQWIGNFHIAKEFQDEHELWESYFWRNVVTRTKNRANRGFKAQYNASYYANTRSDKIEMLSHKCARIKPANKETGYTRSEFCLNVISLVHYFQVAAADTTPAPNTAWVDPTKLRVTASADVTSAEYLRPATGTITAARITAINAYRPTVQQVNESAIVVYGAQTASTAAATSAAVTTAAGEVDNGLFGLGRFMPGRT